MTTTTDSPEVDQLKASIEWLREENLGLASEIEDLRGQLAEARCLTPYDLPADVLAVLTILLPGWPARRCQLAALIEYRAIPDRRAP